MGLGSLFDVDRFALFLPFRVHSGGRKSRLCSLGKREPLKEGIARATRPLNPNILTIARPGSAHQTTSTRLSLPGAAVERAFVSVMYLVEVVWCKAGWWDGSMSGQQNYRTALFAPAKGLCGRLWDSAGKGVAYA